MKKIFLMMSLLLGFATNATDYSSSFWEPSSNIPSEERVKLNLMESNGLTSVSSNLKATFSIGTIPFEMYYSDSEELVLLTRFDDMENRWRWVLVGDVDTLERSCRAEGGGADCSELGPYLIQFTERATAILQRDYGDVVVIPETWKDQLSYYIANNVEFDESQLILSFSY